MYVIAALIAPNVATYAASWLNYHQTCVGCSTWSIGCDRFVVFILVTPLESPCILQCLLSPQVTQIQTPARLLSLVRTFFGAICFPVPTQCLFYRSFYFRAWR